MTASHRLLLFILLIPLLLSACTGLRPATIPIEETSATPGTQVSKAGTPLDLMGTPIKVGDPIPATALVNAYTLDETNLASKQDSVLFLNIVPSLDTKVCDVQTHYLGEKGDTLPSAIERIVISRDLPFAQKRFAEEAGLAELTYLSDYKEGDFGKATGLLLAGPRLLARSVVLVDRQGIIRYIQVVPDITHLPDMSRAFAVARELAEAKQP